MKFTKTELKEMIKQIIRESYYGDDELRYNIFRSSYYADVDQCFEESEPILDNLSEDEADKLLKDVDKFFIYEKNLYTSEYDISCTSIWSAEGIWIKSAQAAAIATS